MVRSFVISLAVASGLSAAPAHATWLKARTDHFVVYSEGSVESTRDLASRLERFDKGMRYLRGLPDNPGTHADPLTVYAVRDVATVQRLCGRCGNVYGFYTPHVGRSVIYTPLRTGSGSKYDLQAETVLYHEYSHHLMFSNYLGAFPAWVTEGYAEFHGTARFEKDGSLGIGLIPLHRAYGLVNDGALSIPAILADRRAVRDPQQLEAVYARGWLLIHYLSFEPKREGQLGRYLNAINDGTPADKAAVATFGDLKQLDRDLGAYMRRKGVSYRRIPADRIAIPAIAVEPLLPGAAAMMPVAMRSDRGVNRAQAGLVVGDARRLAAPFPGDPDAQVALAEAEYDAGHDVPALGAADRALAADPKDIDAMLYKGRALIRMARAAKATDPAVWRDARKWFVSANRAAPDRAEPLMLFYDSFAAAGATPTANAVMGLERAFELSPQADELRMRLAVQYLRDRRSADARRMLAPIAFQPHAAAGNKAALAIAAIDAGTMPAIDTLTGDDGEAD